MSERKVTIGRRFDPRDLKAWQKRADEECAGNLTEWMRQKLNNSPEPVREVLERVEKKLDEVLDNYIEWE